jgi:hypothetical protein
MKTTLLVILGIIVVFLAIKFFVKIAWKMFWLLSIIAVAIYLLIKYL